LSGKKDALIYALKGAGSLPYNEHRIYFWERIAVGLLFASGFFMTTWLDLIVVSINVMLGFSFWHNGFYFLLRRRIDGKYSGFKSNSIGGTAIFNLSYNTRSVMEILAWVEVVIYLCYLKNA